MTTKKEDEILRQLLKIYGVEYEALNLAEECGELIKEISKSVRYGKEHPGNVLPDAFKENIADEMADVCIKVDQMIIAFGLDPLDVQDAREKKMIRLSKKLEKLSD